MKNAVKHFPESELVPYVNAGSAIVAGAVVPFGSGYGIAQEDIAASTGKGTLHTCGVFELPKNTHASTKAFAQGEAVYWDATNSRCDKVGTVGARYLGRAYVAATSTATTVQVQLNAKAANSGGVSVVVDSTMAAANSTNGRVDIDTGLGRAPSAVQVTVLTTSTLLNKTAFKVDLASVAGTIRVDGVGSGTQLDAGDIVHVSWWE